MQDHLGVPCSHLGPSQAGRNGLVTWPWLLKCEVRQQTVQGHRGELPKWLLRPSFSSKGLAFTNCSLAWPGTPPPRHLDAGAVWGPITECKVGEGGASLQFTPTWLPGLGLPATCGQSLAPVRLQLQLPDTTPASRQGISVRLLVGTASVGVVPAQARASPLPFPRTTLLESSLGSRDCAGGS